MTVFGWLAILVGMVSPLLCTACDTRAVDLGGAEEIGASDDPSVLGTVQEEVAQVAVDGERLFWLGSGTTRTAYARGNGDEGKAGLAPNPWAIRSCAKADCAHTRVTIAEDSVDPSAGFSVQAGVVYWFSVVDLPSALGKAERLLGCAIDTGGGDCPILFPQLLARPTLGNRSVAAFDSGDVYFLRDASDGGHEIASMTLSFSGPLAPRTVAIPGGEVFNIAVHDDYLYWAMYPTTFDPRTRTVSSDGSGASILRIRKDGTGAAQVLTVGQRIGGSVGDATSFPPGGLAFDEEHLYWVENMKAGSIQRCELPNCADSTETLIATTGAPKAIIVGGDKLYWAAQQDDQSLRFAISSCELPSCLTLPTPIDGLETPAAFTFSDNQLYAATDDLMTGFSASGGFGFINSLRRFAH